MRVFAFRSFSFTALLLTFAFIQSCKEQVAEPTQATQPEPVVLSSLDSLTLTIVDAVSVDTLLNTVRVLTGEQSFTLHDTSVTIVSRFPTDSTHAYAIQYIVSRFESYGLSVNTQPFIWASHPEYHGVNILATQLGTSEPDSIIIICAHYDAAYKGGFAPGADDNASGVATTIEAARILSRLKTRRTIIYACWDIEEEGLIGSAYFAADAKASGLAIVFVLNLDQVGIGGLKNEAMFSANSSPLGTALLDTIARLNQVFKLPIELDTLSGQFNGSDNASFESIGYQAGILIEWPPSELRHTPNDISANLRPEFFRPCTQLAIAFLYRISIL